MKRTTRILGIVLAVLMVFGLFPLTSIAASSVTLAAWESPSVSPTGTDWLMPSNPGPDGMNAYGGLDSSTWAPLSWVSNSYQAAVSGNASDYTNWAGGGNYVLNPNKAGQKWSYWILDGLTAQGYQNLTLSFDVRSSASGPRNFKLQYALNDGEFWTDVPGGSYAVTSTTLTPVGPFTIPADANNARVLYFRMLMTDNLQSCGNGSFVTTVGTSGIANIKLTGEPMVVAPEPNYVFRKVTSAASLVSGGEYVLYGTGGNVTASGALGNTVSGGSAGAIDLTNNFVGADIVDPPASAVWMLIANPDVAGQWMLYNAVTQKYLNIAGDTTTSLSLTNTPTAYYTASNSVRWPGAINLKTTAPGGRSIMIFSGTQFRSYAADGAYGGPVYLYAKSLVEFPVASPEASVKAGLVEPGTAVSLSQADGTPIHYTTDGTTPSANSPIYSKPITVPYGGVTVKAVAIAGNGDTSAVVSLDYRTVITISEALQKVGQTVTVEGYASYYATTSYGYANGLYIQDASGAGIQVYKPSTAVTFGYMRKIVRVTGVVTNDNKLMKIVIPYDTSVQITNPVPAPIAPVATTIQEIQQQANPFMLVSLENVTLLSVGGTDPTKDYDHLIQQDGRTVTLRAPGLQFAEGSTITIQRAVATVSGNIEVYVNRNSAADIIQGEASTQTVPGFDIANWVLSADTPLSSNSIAATGGYNRDGATFQIVQNDRALTPAWGGGGLRVTGFSSGANKAWLVTKLSSAGFTGVQASIDLRASAAGPSDFRVEYSTDGTTWAPATAPADIKILTDVGSGVFETFSVALPEDADNQETLYVRWLLTSNTAVNGGAIDFNGALNINNIVLSGVSSEDDMNSSIQDLLVTSGQTYDVPLKGSNISSFAGTTFTLSYNATTLELQDFAAQTAKNTTAAGAVAGTGLTILSNTNGALTFTVNKTIPAGQMWDGVLTVLKFKALRSGNTALSLTDNGSGAAGTVPAQVQIAPFDAPISGVSAAISADDSSASDAYTEDATWAPNTPVDVESPPTFTVDDSSAAEYVYIPIAERENAAPPAQEGAGTTQPDEPVTTTPAVSWDDYLNSLTPEEKATWDRYVSIMQASIQYSDLSSDDLTFLCENAKVNAEDLAALEGAGLTLVDSLPYAQAALRFNMSATQLLDNFQSIEQLDKFTVQMGLYLFRVNEQLYGGTTDTMLRGYLLEGYSCNQVISAYGVSCALDIPMGSLLTEKGTNAQTNEQQPAESDSNTAGETANTSDTFSSIDEQNYKNLASDLNVNADALKKYAADNGLSFRDVEQLTNNAPAYVSALKTSGAATVPTQTMQAPIMAADASLNGSDSGSDNSTSINKTLGAPYSYDYNTAEKINLNTGALVYENVDYTLPGVNGLDLVIGRRYDSSEANVSTPAGYYSTAESYTHKYSIVSWTEWYQDVPGIGRDPMSGSHPGSKTTTYYTSQSDAMAALKASYTDNQTVGTLNGFPIIRYTTYYYEFVDEATFSGYTCTYYSYTMSNTYLNDLYGLGTGWSFMFSSIDASDVNNKVLYLADGREFEISITSAAGDSNLKNYTLSDLRLEQESGGYSNGVVSSYYTLYYKDGEKEYFSSDGKLIGIRDRYGNTIKFVNDTLNGLPRITITDTLGRVTTISSSAVISGARTVTVALPNSVNLKYTVSTITSPITYSSLTAYADPMGVSTNYTYTVSAAGFDAYSKGTSAATIYYMNLTRIQHPTGASSEFTYEPVQQNLGFDGLQIGFRITSRYDKIGTTKYNEKTYAYSSNNFSGWPAQSDPANLPTAFTYSTTVKTTLTGLTEAYTFNSQHLTTSVQSTIIQYFPTPTPSTTYMEIQKIQDVLYEYNGDKLPTKTTTKLYDATNQSASMQTITCQAYDNKGNVIASWSPLANGNTSNTEYKTSYTYDLTYSQLTSTSYKQNASMTVRIDYALDANKLHPISKVISVNGAQKAKTEWDYDSYGNITTQRDYKDGLTAYNLTEYTYQNNAYAASVKTSGVLNADGANVTGSPGYAAGVIVTQCAYDNLGNLTQMTDPRGNVTKYAYNAKNDLIKATNPDGSMKQYARDYTTNYLIATDELGTQVKTTYTALGQEYEIIDVKTGTAISRKSYDTLNRVSTVTDLVDNSVMTYTYDGLDRVTATTVKQGATTLSQETDAYAVTSDGLAKTTKTQVGDANAPSIVTTSYVNNMGLEVKTGKVLNGTEAVDTFQYDYLDNKIQTLSALDASNGRAYTSKWESDYAGHMTKETNALGQFSTRTYDALGNNVSVTDLSGNVSTFTYDALGRLIKQETPFEKVGSTVYNAIQKHDYDQNGNVVREQTQKNASGAATSWAKTEYIYNSRGFLTSSISYDGTNEAQRVAYTYDPMGNLLTQTVGGVTTTYTYDRFSNVTQMVDPLGQSESCAYDLVGHITSKTDRDGTVASYTYDGLGRPLTTTVTQNGAVTGQTALSYTLTGQTLKLSNDSTNTTYTYDALGRLTKAIESGGVVKTYGYDIGGNRTSFTLAVNNTTQINTTYLYDTLSRLTTVKEGGTTQVSYTYDPNGNRASMTEGNGISTTYTYNLANLVTSLTNKNGSTVRSSYAYTYYLDGNQKSKADNTGKTTAYAYDGLGRLVSESESGPSNAKTYAYTYDARGNRSSLTVTGSESYTTTYNYDAGNRLLNTAKAEAGTVETTIYQYAPDGSTLSNLVEKVSPSTCDAEKLTVGGDGWELDAYDGFSQQTSTVAGVAGTAFGKQTTYTYRADGLRNSKDNTTFVWDGQETVAELSGGRVKALYVRGINLIYAQTSDGRVYYSYSAHGDVVQLHNSSGVVTRTYSYDAFGVEQNPVAGDTNPWRYCGEYFDLETGTIYLRARYYDPVIGRFISEDTHWGPQNSIYGDDPKKATARKDDVLGLTIYTYRPNVITIEQSVNLYVYGLNNPIRFIDPSGLASYTNRISRISSGVYSVTTTIQVSGAKLTYYYRITDGVINFPFATNNYWSVFWRGGGYTLATAMYYAAKTINKNYLSGRTINGIYTELTLHWAAYTLGIAVRHTSVADMGGTNKNKPGYDKDAWVSECSGYLVCIILLSGPAAARGQLENMFG